MIKELLLEDGYYKNYTTEADLNSLKNISKINIFIGANNSGKSKLLRTIFFDENIYYKDDEIDLDRINTLIKNYKSELEILIKNEIHNEDEVKNQTINVIDYVIFLTAGLSLNNLVRKNFQDVVSFRGNIHSKYQQNEMSIRNRISDIAKKYLDEFDKLAKDYKSDFRLKNMYVPTLRGMRKIEDANKDVYLSATINDYFKITDKENLESKIITGLKLNEDLKEHLLGSRSQRKQVRDFENFLSKTFFDNKEVNIIPKTKGDVVHFMIDDEEREIYNLGDGIQSIIILTYPLFFNQDKKVNFFIEEPEHYLHPGFQRIYIETLLLPQFKNFQYFITTHSNHLLDITLDINQISIYTFQRKQGDSQNVNFLIKNVENEDFNTLELIGVRNSSLFLSNSTIWVEGITDRIYLRKYLDIFQKDQKAKFVEDIHYSFVEYGGGNITHWSFLENADNNHPNIQVEQLCSKLFLISDKDDTEKKSSSKKSLRQEQLAEKLGERYYRLDAIEIENILSADVIKGVIREYESSNTKLKFMDSFISENYKNEHLGTFIENNLIDSKRSYADSSGTIKDKINFSKKAVSYIKKREDMSEDALVLTKKIYDFISSQNT